MNVQLGAVHPVHLLSVARNALKATIYKLWMDLILVQRVKVNANNVLFPRIPVAAVTLVTTCNLLNAYLVNKTVLIALRLYALNVFRIIIQVAIYVNYVSTVVKYALQQLSALNAKLDLVSILEIVYNVWPVVATVVMIQDIIVIIVQKGFMEQVPVLVVLSNAKPVQVQLFVLLVFWAINFQEIIVSLHVISLAKVVMIIYQQSAPHVLVVTITNLLVILVLLISHVIQIVLTVLDNMAFGINNVFLALSKIVRNANLAIRRPKYAPNVMQVMHLVILLVSAVRYNVKCAQH